MPRVRVVQIPRRAALSRCLAAALFTVAWAMELWLLVVGLAVATVAVVHSQRWHRHTFVPALLAGRAVAGPPGRDPAVAVEDWAGIWLALLSRGHPRWLRQAGQLVAAGEHDPWRTQVAIARLEAAETALTEGRILGLSARTRLPAGWRVVAWGIVVAVLVAVANGKSTWWLAPIGAALAALTLSLIELKESRLAPHRLATEVLTGQAVLAGWGNGEASALELALLAGGNHDALRRARRLVERTRREIPHREAALRQLRAAEAMTSHAGPGFALVSDGGLHWWIASVAPVLGVAWPG
jgi:hypothetical protein